MFDNIGGKINEFAKILSRLGIFLGIVVAGVFIYLIGNLSIISITAILIVVVLIYILAMFFIWFRRTH